MISQIHADLEGMSDGSFAWTTPEQIDSMIRFIRQDATHEENNREESMVATTVKTKDVGKEKSTKSEKENKNKKQEEKQSTSSTNTNPKQSHDDDANKSNKSQDEKLDPEILEVKKSIHNMIIIPDEKTGKPHLLVNRRTGAVSKIIPTDNHSIIRTASVGTKSLYSIPLDVAKHLKFDECKIKHKNFESPRQLIDILSGMLPKNAKLSVFWSMTQ